MRKPCILVCPMDWGMGHASRCVPVIKAFISAGCRVVVAASGPGAELIKREFGNAGPAPANVTDQLREKLIVVPFPGFPVSYPRRFLFLSLMLKMPLFLFHKAREKSALKGLVNRFSPDLIVSDNRYGLVHGSVPSIIITHQLRPAMPVLLKPLEGLVSAVIRRWVKAFDECWIPDYEDHAASGRLTEGREKLPAAFFTGWLSRLTRAESAVSRPVRYRIMALLSGPEPHRTILEDIIISRLSDAPFSVLIVRGLPGSFPEREKRGNLEIVSFLDSHGLMKALDESELIVCRAGYSSVMDLLTLGKDALLVPTPGQTEQKYLCRWLSGKGWFRMTGQKDLAKWDFAANNRKGTAEGQINLGDLLRKRVEAVVAGLATGRKGVRR